MRCEYVVTLRDFQESMKPFRQISRQARIGYVLMVWLIPAICLLTGACLIFTLARNIEEWGWSSTLLISLLLGVALGLPARYRVSIRRAFKQRDVLTQSRPMFFEFDENNVRFIVPQGTEITYPWTSFTNFAEGKEVAVLFIKDAAFHTIPKRAMDEAGWAEVRRLVATHVRKT